eukprot:356736-Chlamydomonas_euryale.AAC.1
MSRGQLDGSHQRAGAAALAAAVAAASGLLPIALDMLASADTALQSAALKAVLPAVLSLARMDGALAIDGGRSDVRSDAAGAACGGGG